MATKNDNLIMQLKEKVELKSQLKALKVKINEEIYEEKQKLIENNSPSLSEKSLN